MASSWDCQLTGAESISEDKSKGQLCRNSQDGGEEGHLVSEAFSFLNVSQDADDNCKLAKTELHDGEENPDVILRKNDRPKRESRHLISDAFSFLTEADNDSEAEENQEQIYSNAFASSTRRPVDLEDNHAYSDSCEVRTGEGSETLVYENISPHLEAVAKNHLSATKGSKDSCKSKDSGFASLERGYKSVLEGGERLGSEMVRGSVSDGDEGDDEEDTGEHQQQLYENQQQNTDYMGYVNGAVVHAHSNILNRNLSEHVYDDLNLSTTSCQSGSFIVPTPYLNNDEGNAIALAAENFSSEDCEALIKKAEETEDKASAVNNIVSVETTNQGQPESLENISHSSAGDKQVENTYDTVICIDFSKPIMRSSAQLGGKTLTPESPSSELSHSGLQRNESNGYDELSEYLASTAQGKEVVAEGKSRGLTRTNSLDDEDDAEDLTEANSNTSVDADQVYEYDTISALDSDRGRSSSTAWNTEITGKTKISAGTMGDNSKSETRVTDVKTRSQPYSAEMGNNLDSDSVDAVLTRRPKIERNLSAEIGSDDSSDEDTGIYAESFRRSNWIRISEEDKMKFNSTLSAHSTTSSSEPPSSRSSISSSLSSKSSIHAGNSGVPVLTSTSLVPARLENLEDITEDNLPISPKDDVFLDPLSESVRRQKLIHKRSDSTTTTASEKEFKHRYVSRRKCLIQRADSQQEYHRLSARVYDQDKQVVIQRAANDDDLGLHLLDSHPAFITSVDPGSPAELAGIQEGQILVSVNDLNVLTTDHADIVKLIQSCEGSVRLGVANSDFQPVRDLQAAIISGFMYKLGNNSFMRTWKKRFFILRQDNCLYYYKNDQESHDPLGAVPLCGYTIMRHTETSKDFCFKAEKYGARTYFFMTDNRDQLTEWVMALTEAAARSKKRKESFLSVSSHNVGLPALDIRRPECTGNLLKMKPSNRSWCKRYCVLKDACIYYYKDVNAFRALGVAHLHGYKVDSENHHRKKYSFSLQPPESRMRSFHFAADNETDKKRWVETLIHSIQRWVRVEREGTC